MAKKTFEELRPKIVEKLENLKLPKHFEDGFKLIDEFTYHPMMNAQFIKTVTTIGNTTGRLYSYSIVDLLPEEIEYL